MPSFTQLKSVQRLTELAEEPYDLTKEDALSSKRIDSMIKESLGLKLF